MRVTPGVPAFTSTVASTLAGEVSAWMVSTTTNSVVHFSGVTVHRT
ncbi:hypothetical protein ACE2AJ_20535 [Aquihabitans daechungensis]